jgi:DNA mismatch endonuclease (patch repair protein)
MAVFIDGCFWHGCPEHGRRLHSVNGWYWPKKIARNVERDADTTRRLEDAGWHVIRSWEHESPIVVARRIADAVRGDARPSCRSLK